MKKLARILSVLMIAALMATLCASCKKDDNVLRMGTNAEFPPYEFKEGNEIVGIDAEIAGLIAKELGMELEIVDMSFDGVLPAVQTGSVDIGMAGLTVTPEREKNVSFSKPYATGVQVIIVKEGSAIKSPDDLNGKKIGVQEATTGDAYATKDFGEESVKRFENGALAVKELQNGNVDAVIIDNEPAKAFVAANEGLTILETEYAVEEYAIAISKDNPELLKDVNAAIDKLKENGKIDEVINKYIPAE